jgi:hypothetical protein
VTRRAVFAGILTLGLIDAAAAQTVPPPPPPGPQVVRQPAAGLVPPHEVLTIVRSTGLNPLERPARRGATYALRAVDIDGQQVRVVVDARSGEILSVTLLRRQPLAPGPGIAATPSLAPGPNTRRNPDDAPDGYIGPEPHGTGIYRSDPPVIYESERPLIYDTRPPAPVPNVRQDAAVPSDTTDTMQPTPQIIAPEPGTGGLLPPPPERFPQRAAPPPEPRVKPAPRRAASALPRTPPLPKPRPDADPGPASENVAPPAAPPPAAQPEPPAARPEPPTRPGPEQLPH